MNEVITYYNSIASYYDEDRFNNSYGKYIDQQERVILDRLLKNERGVVLDLACGSGRFLNYATLGVDASEEMIKQAKQKYPNKEIYLSDAGQLPLETGSVNVIICFHCFMHLNEAKVKEILNECYRVLKTNGRLIFDLPSKKRRELFKYRKSDWHGAFSRSVSELKEITKSSFNLSKTYGLLFMPIHRFPKSVRKYFVKLDQLIANSFWKSYSSYLVFEFIKK